MIIPWCMPNSDPLASTHCIHLFSAYCTALQMENSMKSICTINPAITENKAQWIAKVCAPVINLKVGVSLDHSVYASTALS